MSKSFVNRLLLVIGFTVGMVGCGGQRTLPVKQTYPVTGRLTLKGKPVAFAIIHLSPQEGKGAEATGYSDKDGNVQFRTYSNNEMDGVAPGEYSVEVEPYNATIFLGTRPKPGETPSPVPVEIQHPDTTVVVDETTTEIPIQL
ncbi:MAG TPA: hypothetical protein VMG10_16225 [Gemmataceae bacterium]|nr:hypothetical protein [Gemmataceae bacterium]